MDSCQREEESCVKQDNEQYNDHQIESITEKHYEIIGNHDNTCDHGDSSLLTFGADYQQLDHSQSNNNTAIQQQCFRSCRQEACYYPSDITVDELAGYLDELLYIPKPMSDMAELMYT